LVIVKQNFRYLLHIVDFCNENNYELKFFNLAAPSTRDKNDYLKYIFKLSEISRVIKEKKVHFNDKTFKSTIGFLMGSIPLCIIRNFMSEAQKLSLHGDDKKSIYNSKLL